MLMKETFNVTIANDFANIHYSMGVSGTNASNGNAFVSMQGQTPTVTQYRLCGYITGGTNIDLSQTKSMCAGDFSMKTPEFQGTHLWDRLGWAKENLEPFRSEFCIVWEDPDNLDEPAKVTHPDPNWMACALNGGILPPVWVYWELKKDEAQPDFVKHTRGYLLHNTEPVKAMTEEEAIEYLIQKRYT